MRCGEKRKDRKRRERGIRKGETEMKEEMKTWWVTGRE